VGEWLKSCAIERTVQKRNGAEASFLKKTEDQTDEDLFHERAGIYAELVKSSLSLLANMWRVKSGT